MEERKEINVPTNILSATFIIGVRLFGTDYKFLLPFYEKSTISQTET